MRAGGEELDGEVTSVPCKICQTPSPLHGVVDRNKSCEASRGRFFPLAGEPVWYHRCPSCGFLFTTYFDEWTPDDWKREIYNADYGQSDPDHTGARAHANSQHVATICRTLNLTRILDYGGGNGYLARILTEGFFDAWSWDPFYGDTKPVGDFDLVTAFEVMEHTTEPRGTLNAMLGWLRPGGAVFFTTLTCDEVPPQSVDWWYIAPRNGHVSIHTKRSLALLFGDTWHVEHLTSAYHLARRR